MCGKEWMRIAESEARKYRDRQAFLRGFRDAGGVCTERSAAAEKWVLAVDYVLEYLRRTDPEKERFMRLYFGLDGERRRACRKSVVSLSLQLNASITTLYEWRREILSLLVIAATQTRAIYPFEIT